MNFETLEKFEWYNEPDNVRFENATMVIYAKANTDFWQSIHRDFKKDNGHFFYCVKNENFRFTLKWHFDEILEFSQCGLMLRIDQNNWFKVSMMNEKGENDILASSLTINGHSDWNGFSIHSEIKDIWFRLERVNNDYILYYSLDGEKFTKMKLFYLEGSDKVQIGAYIACPTDYGFHAELSNIRIDD